jgi:hypothetical protein
VHLSYQVIVGLMENLVFRKRPQDQGSMSECVSACITAYNLSRKSSESRGSILAYEFECKSRI